MAFCGEGNWQLLVVFGFFGMFSLVMLGGMLMWFS